MTPAEVSLLRWLLLVAFVCFIPAGCGGGGAEQDVTNIPATPSDEIVSIPVGCPSVSPSLLIQREKLTNWFSGGVAGKKIIWVGDSTTEKMGPVALFGWAGVNDYFLKKYVNNIGLPLYGTIQVWLGSNGNVLSNFVANYPNVGLSSAIAESGDMYIMSYGINDVRRGGVSESDLVTNLRIAVNAIRATQPNADIILRMPNSLLSADVNANGWVIPNSSAQAYTDILRAAYRSLENEWPNVVVYDSQELLFTEVSSESNPYMLDQLHPNAQGYFNIYDDLVEIIGQSTASNLSCP